MAESNKNTVSPKIDKGSPKPITPRFRYEADRLHVLLQSADEYVAYGLNLDKDHYDELVYLLARFSNR